jgi:hypothetical protein
MFIFDRYVTSITFKNKSSNRNDFIQFSQKNTSLTIHNTVFSISLSLIYYTFSSIIYRFSFYSFIIIDTPLLMFLSSKSISRLIY